MDAFIELKNVVKSYTMGDVTIYANNGVNFKVNKGEFTVIVGASGAGKTTILNMLGYKNEYALGHDIFNIKNNNVVAFPNGNFLSSVMYYNNSTGEYYVINDSTVIDDNYVDKTKESVEKMLEVSNSIIVYDLLNKKESSND